MGGRIYWETHLAPLLHVDGRFDEVALELVTPSGRLPVVMSAVRRAAIRRRPVRTRVAIHERLGALALRAGAAAARSVARALRRPGPARCSTRRRPSPAPWASTGVAAAAARRGGGPARSPAATLWLADPGTGVARGLAAGERPAPSPRRPGDLAGARRGVRRRRAASWSPARPGPLQGCCRCGPRRPGRRPAGPAGAHRRGPAGRPRPGPGAPLRAERERGPQLQRSLLPSRHRTTRASPWPRPTGPGGDARGRRRLARHLSRRRRAAGPVRGRRRRSRPPAASAMGQLRSAVRAVAGPEAGPARLLSRLDRSSSRSRRPAWPPSPTPSSTWRRASCATPARGTRRRCSCPPTATRGCSGTDAPPPWGRSPGRSTGARPGSG